MDSDFTDSKMERRALANARQAQALTDQVQARIRELDAAVPKVLPPVDDPKRGCVSPAGGAGWFTGFAAPADRKTIWNANGSRK